MSTYNGITIISTPCYTIPHVAYPSSIEWHPQEAVATTQSPFTGAIKSYDWGASWWEGQVSFPPMDSLSASAWQAFLLACRGASNGFMLGDPKGVLPRGSALGEPTLNGANQTGYSVSTRGWRGSAVNVLMAGDYIQIGVHLYKVLENVSSDVNGNVSFTVWPNLRSDAAADGTPIITKGAQGLFRIKNPTKFSVNSGLYGLSPIEIAEVL